MYLLYVCLDVHSRMRDSVYDKAGPESFDLLVVRNVAGKGIGFFAGQREKVRKGQMGEHPRTLSDIAPLYQNRRFEATALD